MNARYRFMKSAGWCLSLALGICGSAIAQGKANTAGGAATFKAKCVLCHGVDGTGNTPLGKQLQAANLHSKDVQSRSDDELRTVVHDGKTNMPPFGDQLTDDEIVQVIQYVRAFATRAKVAKKQ